MNSHDAADPVVQTKFEDESSDAVAVFTADESPIGACIVYVNRAFVELTGYEAEQVVGHSSLLLAGARPDLRHVRDVARAPRDETFFTETTKARPDGATYDVEMWLSPIYNPLGDVTHYVLRQHLVSRRRQ